MVDVANDSKPMPTTAKLSFVDGMRLGPWVWVATGLGIGFVPWAPGTFGTLWGLPLAWGINHFSSVSIQAVCVVAICAIGIPICHYGAMALGCKDPGSVVWDEIAAMPITFFLVPNGQMSNLWVLLAGFVLFRFFDITKIPPARQVERFPTGLGIMADDWVAGVYACGCLHLILWLKLLP